MTVTKSDAHKTLERALKTHAQTMDVLDIIFHPGTVWAVKDYLNELREERRGE